MIARADVLAMAGASRVDRVSANQQNRFEPLNGNFASPTATLCIALVCQPAAMIDDRLKEDCNRRQTFCMKGC
jgi:hypothetical protein